MAINYVLNSKDSKMLIYEGFIHCKVNDQEDKTCWRCSEYKRIKCRGQVYLSGNKISKYVGHNNHVPNAAKVEAKKALAILRMTAKRTMLSAEDVLRYTASKVRFVFRGGVFLIIIIIRIRKIPVGANSV